MPKASQSIFISHAHADRRIAGAFAALLNHCIGPNDSLFFSTWSNTGTPNGRGIKETLLSQLEKANKVVFLVSEHFYASTFCLAELGAAWGLKKRAYFYLIPPLPHDLEGLLRDIAVTRLERGDSTNGDQVDLIPGQLGLAEAAKGPWQQSKNAFVQQINQGPEDISTIEQLRGLGLLGGLYGREFLNLVVRRLLEAGPQKEAIGRYLAERTDPIVLTNQRRTIIFIESGSTLAYFAKYLSTLLIAHNGGGRGDDTMHAHRDRIGVITNSFLVQQSLVGLLEQEVTPGKLRRTYVAYLPFFAAKRTEHDRPKQDEDSPVHDEAVSADRVSFERVCQLISQADIIYGSCSTFGFIIGPLTGTRDNALFKLALFYNYPRRPIRLCVSATKVFTAAEADGKSVFEHVDECYSVFDIELPKRNGGAAAGRASDDPWPAIPDSGLLRGTGDREVTRRCAAMDRYRVYKLRSARTELRFSAEKKGDQVDWDVPRIMCPDLNWIGYLEGQPSGSIEILIGCESHDEAQAIRRSYQQANSFLANRGVGLKYEEHQLATVASSVARINDAHKEAAHGPQVVHVRAVHRGRGTTSNPPPPKRSNPKTSSLPPGGKQRA